MTSSLPRRAIALAVVLGCAWAAWLGLRHIDGQASVLDRAEDTAADFRVLIAGARPAPASVVIVAIDDATVAAEGGYPLPRARLADLVRAIGTAGASALAVDLLLVDPGPEAGDRALATALAARPTVIAAAAKFDTAADRPAGDVPHVTGALLPLPIFSAAARTGFVNVATDAGGTPRFVPLVFRTDAGLAPSLALAAAEAFTGRAAPLGLDGVRVDGVLRRLDLGWHLPLRSYGPRGTIATFSAAALLGPAPPDLTGRMVVLGATATGIGDRFSTAFDPVLPGVEVLATGIANLLDGGGLVRDRTVRRVDAGAAVALAVAGMLAASFAPLAAAAAGFAALLAAWLLAITVLFAQGYWLSAVLPLAGAVPPVVLLGLARQIADRRQARRVATERAELTRFMAPALARRLATDPDFLRVPRAQDAAVLFVDLAGFTGLAERLGPQRSRDILKEFHTVVVDCSGRRGGIVLDFMGDGAMIVFGLPEPGQRDAQHALQTAFDLVAEVRGWIGRSGLDGAIGAIRVGAHFGPVVVSRLGHDLQQQIAATGDCVNVASRLQDAGKTLNAQIVASAALEGAARTGAADLPEPGETREIAIRGRQGGMQVALWRAAPAMGGN